MVIFLDKPYALVTDHIVVIRTSPPLRLSIDEIEDEPRVLGRAAHPVKICLLHACLGGVLIMIYYSQWLVGFLAGSALVFLTTLGLALLRYRSPRCYDLRVQYDGVEVILLTATSRSMLRPIGEAITRAKRTRRPKVGPPGHSFDRAA